MWLGGRNDTMGDWSHAGGILRIVPGGPWFAALPEEAWPEDERARADIRKARPFGKPPAVLKRYCRLTIWDRPLIEHSCSVQLPFEGNVSKSPDRQQFYWGFYCCLTAAVPLVGCTIVLRKIYEHVVFLMHAMICGFYLGARS